MRGNRRDDSKNRKRVEARNAKRLTEGEFGSERVQIFTGRDGRFLIGRGGFRAPPFANLFIERHDDGLAAFRASSSRPANLIRGYVLPFQRGLILWSLTVMLVTQAILFRGSRFSLFRLVSLINPRADRDQPRPALRCLIACSAVYKHSVSGASRGQPPRNTIDVSQLTHVQGDSARVPLRGAHIRKRIELPYRHGRSRNRGRSEGDSEREKKDGYSLNGKFAFNPCVDKREGSPGVTERPRMIHLFPRQPPSSAR